VLGVAALAGVGLLLLADLMAGVGVDAVLVALTVAVVPAPLLVGLVRLADRFEPEPPRMLAVTFLYGATAAVVLAGLLNTVGAGLLAGRYDPQAAQLLTIAGLAPVGEEADKGAAVLVFAWRHRSEFTGVVDGLVYSAMVGLGFAVTENVTYYLGAMVAGGEEALAAVVIARGVLSPFAHPLFTAMSGIGLAVAAQSARWRPAPAVLGFAGAAGLHALWNTASLAGAAFVPVYVVVFVPIFAVVVIVAVRATRREGRLLRRYLAEEVDADRLTSAEVATLGSLRSRRRAERASAAAEGRAAGRVHRSFHHAATQLAFTRHRRRGGAGGRVPASEVEDFWLAELQRRRALLGRPRLTV
jgi:RsiW-degrading membrane proteinase PrsW (M82 family)